MTRPGLVANRWTFGVIFAALICSAVPVCSAETALDLMPVPAELEPGAGSLRVDDGFTVGLEGHDSERLRRATMRMLRRLTRRTGLFLPAATFSSLIDRETATLRIECQRQGTLVVGEDESYRLEVSPRGAVLKAPTDLGALHGLETLLQLLSADEHGYFFQSVVIEDRPRFPWRGLLVDVSRHFMPVEVLKRNLDGMAAVKLNVFHWHLTDDQGFRVECTTHPRLHQLGSDGFFYSHAQIREVIDYAADRGIRVVPEFDLPGHATSWLVGYPELASQPGPYVLERSWGIMDPTLDPTKEETYAFLDSFFAEMATLFPETHVHIGGDEVTGKHWITNRRIRSFMKRNGLADAAALQRYFNQRLLAILEGHGRSMIGWDEVLQPGLPASVIVQSWRGREGLYAAARAGHRTLLSNGYYIDLNRSTEHHYLNDPLPADAPLSAIQRARVLGGEATMWAEYVNPEIIDSRIWPRMAAIAERLWSPHTVQDVDDMYRRLDTTSRRLEELGLTHKRNTPMLLRRLTGGADISSLQTLVSLLEPVKGYRRWELRPHTSFSPLSRVVDTARPDQPVARRFRRLVDDYLKATPPAGPAAAAIRQQLGTWRDNHDRLSATIRSSPVLKEIEPMSQNLATVATLGLEALQALETGTTPDRDWLDAALEVLAAAAEPHGQTELMILPAVVRLVCSAGAPSTECGLPAEQREPGGH